MIESPVSGPQMHAILSGADNANRTDKNMIDTELPAATDGFVRVLMSAAPATMLCVMIRGKMLPNT
jgi:hypothetical protein